MARIAQDLVNNDEWLPKLTTYYISFSQKFLSKKITCMANFNFSFLISYCNHIYLELYLKPSLVSISGVGPHSGGGLRSPKCERLFLHTCQESEPGPGARCRGSATGVQLLSLSTWYWPPVFMEILNWPQSSSGLLHFVWLDAILANWNYPVVVMVHSWSNICRMSDVWAPFLA